MAIDIQDLEIIALKLGTDFDFYKNKNIFLTGGTGFFGKWLLGSFIYLNDIHNLNISVTILSRSPEKFKQDYPHFTNHENFAFIQGDIRSFSECDEQYDLIIHAATDASVALNKSKPELMRNTIIDGAKRICELADRVNCKRILYTSSGAAYGPQPESLTHMPETFADNALFNHNDAYASAKLESEKYFKENAPCDVVIARCFAFAGPYLPLNGGYAFGNFIDDILNKRDIVIHGDGSSIRSYLYASDLVVWLMKLLSSGKNRENYNVGSERGISISQLAEIISNISGSKNKVKILGKVSSTRGSRNYVPNVDKIRCELPLGECVSLEDAIKKTIKFYSGIDIIPSSL